MYKHQTYYFATNFAYSHSYDCHQILVSISSITGRHKITWIASLLELWTLLLTAQQWSAFCYILLSYVYFDLPIAPPLDMQLTSYSEFAAINWNLFLGLSH